MWQYKVEKLAKSGAEADEFQRVLDAAGVRNWELVAVMKQDYDVMAIYKRPLVPNGPADY